MDDSSAPSHRCAAAEFARQARERYDDAIMKIVLYGSVARGDHRGVRSDVDLSIVLRGESRSEISKSSFEISRPRSNWIMQSFSRF